MKRKYRHLILECVIATVVIAGLFIWILPKFFAVQNLNRPSAFPDPGLFERVQHIMKVDDDGRFTSEDTMKINRAFACSNRQIKTMRGIRYFTSITDLTCYYNLLTELDLSKNTQLTFLDCSYNRLTCLDLSEHHDLEILICYGNQIEEIVFPKPSKLIILKCQSNFLEKIDLSSMPDLKILDCSNNRLSQIDLSKNNELTFISLQSNQITEIQFPHPNKILSLDIRYNRLSEIPEQDVFTQIQRYEKVGNK
jgi:Leucine-rich repeat (LRR) protein